MNQKTLKKIIGGKSLNTITQKCNHKVEGQGDCEWCSECGAIRTLDLQKDSWSKWRTPNLGKIALQRNICQL